MSLEIDDIRVRRAPFVQVLRTINRPLPETFDLAIEAPLPKIFPTTEAAAGIASTTVERPWNRGGLTRTNTSTDGSTNNEELLGVDRPFSFSYRVFDFSAPALSDLLEGVIGRWYFFDNGNETTNIDWRYILVPRSDDLHDEVAARLVPRFQVRLDTALDILRRLIQGED